MNGAFGSILRSVGSRKCGTCVAVSQSVPCDSPLNLSTAFNPYTTTWHLYNYKLRFIEMKTEAKRR